MRAVKFFTRLLMAACCVVLLPRPGATAATRTASAALEVKEVPASRAAGVLAAIFPDARITVDRGANAIVVTAPQPEIDEMRAILPSIDTRDPRAPTADAVHVSSSRPRDIVPRLRQIFPNARFDTGPNDTVLIVASPSDMDEIKAIISDIDVAPAGRETSAVVDLIQAKPRNVARTVVREVRDVRADVSGNDVIFIGSADAVAQAKAMAAQLDVPPPGVAYVQTYRLGFADASAVANMIERSFPGASVTTDTTLNSVSVNASAPVQARVAASVAQLDAAPGGAPVGEPGSTSSESGPGGTVVEVVNLRAAVPGINGTESTTASDIASTVMGSLGSQAGDLHITIEPNSTKLVISGSQYSVELAKKLIAQLDTAEDLVVLDTQIFEVDETDAKDLGLVAGTPGSPFLSTTVSEYPPQLSESQLSVNPNASPPPF